MSETNPLWVLLAFYGELLKLGINVSQTTVVTHMCRRQRPPSQTRRTFLATLSHDVGAALFVRR